MTKNKKLYTYSKTKILMEMPYREAVRFFPYGFSLTEKRQALEKIYKNER